MKLIFKKDDEAHIQVFQQVNQTEKEFSYEDMIKSLIKNKKLEDPEISEGFSESEISSINSMVQHINNEIAEEEGDGEETDEDIEEEDEFDLDDLF